MPPHALVLEDNDVIAELIRFYLEEAGCEVQVIEYGRAIFETIASFNPDLITLDVELPDVDGLYVFRQLRTRPETHAIPVVFISVAEDRREESLELGAQSFIVKPFSGADLRRALRAALQTC